MTEQATDLHHRRVAELAAGMRRLLGAIEAGELAVDSGMVARLEGAVAVFNALAYDRPVL